MLTGMFFIAGNPIVGLFWAALLSVPLWALLYLLMWLVIL